jgi:hypothetical protein
MGFLLVGKERHFFFSAIASRAASGLVHLPVQQIPKELIPDGKTVGAFSAVLQVRVTPYPHRAGIAQSAQRRDTDWIVEELGFDSRQERIFSVLSSVQP